MRIDLASATQRDHVLDMLGGRLRIVKNGLTFIAREGWVAMPMESGAHLSAKTIDRLVVGAESTGEAFLFLVELGMPDDREPRVFVVPAEPHALEQANMQFALFDIALLAPSGRWLVFCSEADYCVVNGKRDVVETLIGVALDDALERFTSYANSWQVETPRPVRAVAERPWREYENLTPGSEFSVSWTY